MGSEPLSASSVLESSVYSGPERGNKAQVYINGSAGYHTLIFLKAEVSQEKENASQCALRMQPACKFEKNALPILE